MRLAFVSLACVILSSLTLSAAQIKLDSLTVGSQTYHDITVLGLNATDVYFKHSNGIANAKIRQLDKDLQKRLNFNAEAAEKIEKQQLVDDSNYQARLLSEMVTEADTKKAQGTNGSASQQNLFGDPISDKSLIGKQAPAFGDVDWSPAAPQMSDKYVLINFWAPWSSASIKSTTAVKNLQKKVGEKLVLLSVISASTSNDISTSADNGTPQFLDAESKLASRFGVTAVPTAILIDPQGLVLYHGHPAALDDAAMSKLAGK